MLIVYNLLIPVYPLAVARPFARHLLASRGMTAAGAARAAAVAGFVQVLRVEGVGYIGFWG